MNKIIIPSIFVATILVAGMFAFMPVQKAETVHTTILAGTRDANALSLDPFAATMRVVLYDGLGNSKSANIEVVAVLPTGAKIQKSDTITGGAVVWVDVTCDTTVAFGGTPANVHCDVTTKALAVLFDGTNAPGANDYVSWTINGV